MEVYGFEIKVARGDWKRELTNPAKADAIQRYCDRWWIVADEKIVELGELPPTWGLMAPKGEGLKVLVEAPKLEATPLSRKFVAAICRAAQKECPAEERLAAARRDGYADGLAEAENISKRNRGDFDRLAASVSEFEQKAGLSINAWNGGNIGDAVRKVLHVHAPEPRQELAFILRGVDALAKNIRALLSATENGES
jgi:hypothetical protein